MTNEDILDLALQSTGIPRAEWDRLMEIMKVDADMNRVMKSDWFEKPRDSEKAIREYYSSNNIWFVNTFNQGHGALLKLSSPDWMSLVREVRPWHQAFMSLGPPMLSGLRLLDYGGGMWNDSWPLVISGFHVTLAEVKGPLTKFLQAFIEMAHIQDFVEILEVDSETPIHDQYDGITCFETLEHVLKPIELAKHLVDHLKKDGLIAQSTSFGAPDWAPYHVASNLPLSDREVWCGHLRSMGLSRVWIAEDQHFQIWRKA